MLHAHRIPDLQDEATARWHDVVVAAAPSPRDLSALEDLLLQQHRTNFDLWHHEDAARDPHASPSTIARTKRAIDHVNQQRNDLVEQIDLILLTAAGQQNQAAPLHSESPGLIIDRLSILALKIFHTREETTRPGAGHQHHTRNHDRLTVLLLQRSDLAGCLGLLWQEVTSGHRRFKLYRQLKMYNDPTLNPVLYRDVGVL